MCHAAAGLLPDLSRGAKLVGERVRWIRVLIHVDVAVGVGGCATLRFTYRAIRSFKRIGEHDLRTERTGDALAFDGDLVRHAELQVEAADGADHRKGHTGVSARRVEHDPPAAQPALLLR